MNAPNPLAWFRRWNERRTWRCQVEGMRIYESMYLAAGLEPPLRLWIDENGAPFMYETKRP